MELGGKYVPLVYGGYEELFSVLCRSMGPLRGIWVDIWCIIQAVRMDKVVMCRGIDEPFLAGVKRIGRVPSNMRD
jgi:hypothetical protein